MKKRFALDNKEIENADAFIKVHDWIFVHSSLIPTKKCWFPLSLTYARFWMMNTCAHISEEVNMKKTMFQKFSSCKTNLNYNKNHFVTFRKQTWPGQSNCLTHNWYIYRFYSTFWSSSFLKYRSNNFYWTLILSGQPFSTKE